MALFLCNQKSTLYAHLLDNNEWGGTVTPRAGATGGIPGPCPPKWLLVSPQMKIVPPKRGLWPEKINSLGGAGVQIEP